MPLADLKGQVVNDRRKVALVLELEILNLDARLFWPLLSNHIVSTRSLNLLGQPDGFVILCPELLLLSEKLELEDTLSADQIADDRHHLLR